MNAVWALRAAKLGSALADVPDYELPLEAIARQPIEPRDAARLLVAVDGPPRHSHVHDLPALVGEGDVIVVNTSRVVPARLALTRLSGAPAEVLLLEPVPVPATAGDEAPAVCWQALVRPGRKLAPGTVLFAGDRPVVEVGERLAEGARMVRSLVGDLFDYGQVALPPYVHQALDDPERYQTVYAERPGSVAAPTAGLHLTEAVLGRCRQRGVVVAGVDLAVGLGTFRPIKADRVEDHAMHSERYLVPPATWAACQQARRVVAVGTTVVRALESAAATGQMEGRTELFIRPGHPFAVVDVLMTNFHQPRSSLLVLLEAFAGPRWRQLYDLALAEGYRFLSFGDAMVVARCQPDVPG